MYTYDLFFPRISRAEGGREGGRARLAVPWHISGLCGAADGQRVDAVGVAVAVAVVLLSAAVSRGPHKNGPQSTASLRSRKKMNT